MKNQLRKLILVGLLFVASIFLWRAAMTLSAAVPYSFAHGERLVFGLIVTAGVVGFTAMMSRVQNLPVKFAPLCKRSVAQIGLGATCYVFIALGVIGALVSIGRVDVEFTRSSTVWLRFAYLLGLVFLSEALPEEILFRGWIMHSLEARHSPWVAVLSQAAIFTLFAWAVGALNSLDDASFIACFGLVLGIVRAVTGTIWASVGVHLAFITAQQSALPQWSLWAGDPHVFVQMAGLTIVPFSIIVAVLFGRVRTNYDQRAVA